MGCPSFDVVDDRGAGALTGRLPATDGARLRADLDRIRNLILSGPTDAAGAAWLDVRPAGAETRRELFRVHGDLVGHLARLEARDELARTRMAQQTELARTVDREIGRFHDTVNHNREVFLSGIEQHYRVLGPRADLDGQVLRYFTVLTLMTRAFTASIVRLVGPARRPPRRAR